MGREENVLIFQDTERLSKTNGKLNADLKTSASGQKLILETDALEKPNLNIYDEPAKVIVSKKRTFEAAKAYRDNKVAVHNFASASNPGGGVVRGSTAQEECLCRCSTLYPCLNNDKMRQLFYNPHRKAENPLYNDDCIYTPDITVFKTDTSVPEKLAEKDWYQVDVLTCAAPNLRRKPSNSMNPHAGKTAAKIRNSNLYDLLVKRITRIFQVAIANGTEILVLGAFGCGAFCNPPMIVARAFRNVQEKYSGYFDTIEYAVFCKKNETENYDAFCREFPKTRFKS